LFFILDIKLLPKYLQFHDFHLIFSKFINIIFIDNLRNILHKQLFLLDDAIYIHYRVHHWRNRPNILKRIFWTIIRFIYWIILTTISLTSIKSLNIKISLNVVNWIALVAYLCTSCIPIWLWHLVSFGLSILSLLFIYLYQYLIWHSVKFLFLIIQVKFILIHSVCLICCCIFWIFDRS